MSGAPDELQVLADGLGVALRTATRGDPVTTQKLLEILRVALPDAVGDAANWWKGRSRQESAKAKSILMQVLERANAIELVS